MKPLGPEVAQLSPHANGWRLHYAGAAHEMPTLDEAAALVPPRVRLHLALPCQMALLERLTLPATSRDELAGMAQLQLEKTLPYPVEEAASDLEVISHSESESTVLSIAVNTESLSRLCEPLRNKQRLPRKITLYAQHIAAACPAEETVMVLWSEQESLTLGIFENRKLSWAHSVPSATSEGLAEELPSLLLGADLEGVPTNFSRVLLTDECAAFREPLALALDLPIEILPTDRPLPESGANLLPPSWADENKRAERGERLKKRLMGAGVVYLVGIAIAFVYLAFLKHRVQKIDNEIAVLQPKLAVTQAQQKRWQDLAPAIDPNLYVTDLLLQASNSRSNQEVQFTVFDMQPDQFHIVGEAPNPEMALEFEERVRKALSMYHLKDPAPPNFVDDKHTRFEIFGKR